jgi:uncharacterized membrane protein
VGGPGPDAVYPLLVHFPIALVLAAAGAECVAFRTRYATWHAIAVANLRIGAAFGVCSAIAGWVLATAPFVEATPSLALHRRGGVVAAVVTLGAALSSKKSHAESGRAIRLYRGSLLAAAALVAITGHLGGRLVWGTD